MAKRNPGGRVLAWPGGSLWSGAVSGSTTSMHIHHAIQITIALEGTFLLRTSSDATWTEYQGAVIPSHLHHALRILTDSVLVIVWIEPETAEGHALLGRFGADAIQRLPDASHRETSARMADAYEEGQDDARLISAAQDVVDVLTAGAGRRVAVDPRILRAIDHIRSRLQGPIRQEEIAEAVFLSPGRFRHLFVEETGMRFRSYVLWLRLQKALASISAGNSPAHAAVDAGFSDTSHMTRTFSRMFGITPGQLEQNKPGRKSSR